AGLGPSASRWSPAWHTYPPADWVSGTPQTPPSGRATMAQLAGRTRTGWWPTIPAGSGARWTPTPHAPTATVDHAVHKAGRPRRTAGRPAPPRPPGRRHWRARHAAARAPRRRASHHLGGPPPRLAHVPAAARAIARRNPGARRNRPALDRQRRAARAGARGGL